MKALIINGPNLNMLGKRSKEHYGFLTLVEINNLIKMKFEKIDFTFYQTNHEGGIIDRLQDLNGFDFVLINPGAYAHYSYAIKDAFELVSIKKGVCHLSNIETREDYRKRDVLKELADVYVCGLKENSYIEAIKELINLTKENI